MGSNGAIRGPGSVPTTCKQMSKRGGLQRPWSYKGRPRSPKPTDISVAVGDSPKGSRLHTTTTRVVANSMTMA